MIIILIVLNNNALLIKCIYLNYLRLYSDRGNYFQFSIFNFQKNYTNNQKINDQSITLIIDLSI